MVVIEGPHLAKASLCRFCSLPGQSPQVRGSKCAVFLGFKPGLSGVAFRGHAHTVGGVLPHPVLSCIEMSLLK